MTERNDREYAPDYAISPGVMLVDILEDEGITQAALSERIGRNPKTINEIINGKAPIRPKLALQLEAALSMPADYWLNLQSLHDQALARGKRREKLGPHIPWMKRFSVGAMVNLGWFERFTDKVEQMEELLRFLGIASPEQWEAGLATVPACFRESPSFKSKPESVVAWLRQGEIKARAIDCEPYNKDSFKRALSEIRGLTAQYNIPDAILQTQQLCAQSGVALVFVPELPKTHLSGAARWLKPDKSLIQLSLRHKSDDHMWFSFFHEAAHIVLHGKKGSFIRGDLKDESKEEREADTFARNFLIPQNEYDDFVVGQVFSSDHVHRYAEDLGIAPGILVGRLQRDEHVRRNQLNELKRSVDFSKISDAA
jgi:HTH-type transcriptional regulator / antitoxin HigA